MLTIVESPTFSRKAQKLLTADEYAELLTYVAYHPEAGDIIRGSGGFRKLRWGKGNRGKSGGVRTVYFYYDVNRPIYMVAVYGKNERANLSEAEINALYSFAQQIKGEKHAR